MATSTPVQDAIPFLADAAHLLRASAPETSAHLMRHCTDLLQQNSLPLHETQHQHSCGSCGHIMIPGDDASKVRLERVNKRVKKPRASATPIKNAQSPASNALRKQITCGRCNRTTFIKLDNAAKPVRTKRPKPKAVAAAAPSQTPEDTSGPKNKSNASSKKRAKNRKAGLQSLLAAGQGQKSSSLSLSDFMR